MGISTADILTLWCSARWRVRGSSRQYDSWGTVQNVTEAFQCEPDWWINHHCQCNHVASTAICKDCKYRTISVECHHNYITPLSSTLLLVSLFIFLHFSTNIYPGQTHRNTSCNLDSSFCACFPFITAAASLGETASFLLRKPEIWVETQRLAYLPQSGYEGEPSAFQAGD